MNILGMGTLEILVVLLIAFIFLGPQRMVDAARLLGKASREIRRLSQDLPRMVIDDYPEGSTAARQTARVGVDKVDGAGPTEQEEANAAEDLPVAFQPRDASAASDAGAEVRHKQDRAES